MSKFKLSLIYFLPVLAGLLFYFPSLKYGFSQDDFIHLYSSHAESLNQFLNFFNPFERYPDIFFFRPLTTQVYFFINSSLFGLNPFAFHIEALALHITNAYLFYKAVLLIWNRKNIAIISSVLYSLSATHFLSLYYISSFQELGKTFFMLISLLYFVKYAQKRRKLALLGSLVSFIGALLSKETSIVLPLFLICFELFRRRSENWQLVFKQTLVKSLPFFLILLIYTVLRASGFQQTFNEGSYSASFSIFDLLQNLKWYVIWIFGLPEILSTYPSLKPDSLLQFVRDFSNAFWIAISFSLLIISATMASIGLKKFPAKTIILSLGMFIIPILPVLVLNEHKYPQYLDLSLLAILPVFVFILLEAKKLKYVVLTIGLISFVSLQAFSLNLTAQNHWATKRAEIADSYYQSFKKDYPKIEKGTSVVFIGTEQSTKELSIILAKDYALKSWYPDSIKNVLYLNYENDAESIDKKIVKKVEKI